jgi:hypothetical protein
MTTLGLNIHLSYSLHELPCKFFFSLFAMSQFYWPITPKKIEIMVAPPVKGSILSAEFLPFGPGLQVKGGQLLPKHTG